MKRLVGIILLMLTFTTGFADVVKIKAVSNIPATQIRVLLPSDPVSGNFQLVASSKSDFKGNFELEFETNEITFVKLAFGIYQQELLIKPGASYHIQLSLQSSEHRSFYDTSPLEIKILEAKDGGLSNTIELINLSYNTFVVEHFQSLHRLGRMAYLDTLQLIVQNQLTGNNDAYVKNFANYKMASLEPLVKKMTIRQVYERFFQDKPIQYNNPEYMALFENFFSSYFLESSVIGSVKLLEAIALGDQPLLELIAQDPLIGQHKVFGELVLLYHLQGLYFHPSLPPKAVENRLKFIALNSQIKLHQTIAQNIIIKRNHLAFGTEAPMIRLHDINGEIYSPNLEEKLIVLNFLKDYCPLCEHELIGLQNITGKYGEQIQIVSIATKESFQHYSKLFRSNRYQWKLLNLEQNYSLLDAYNIRIFPENIILLKKGKIGMAPAPIQEESLENHLRRLLELNQ